MTKFMTRFGVVVSYLMIPTILVIVWTAVMRYAFSLMPKWGFEVGLFFYGAHLILGGAVCHLNGKHVAVDILPTYLPRRMQKYLTVVGEIAVLVTCAVLVWVGSQWAWQSYLINEHSQHQTEFNPTIWWFKALVPIGGALLGVVSLWRFKNAIQAIRFGDPVETEKKEDIA